MCIFVSCRADVSWSSHCILGVRGPVVEINTNYRHIQTWDAGSNRVPEHASNIQRPVIGCVFVTYVPGLR